MKPVTATKHSNIPNNPQRNRRKRLCTKANYSIGSDHNQDCNVSVITDIQLNIIFLAFFPGHHVLNVACRADVVLHWFIMNTVLEMKVQMKIMK